MKAISHFSGQTILWCGLLAASATFAAQGQTLINLGTQGRNIDFSNAPSTRPEKTGSTLPVTCLPGEIFFELGAPAGQNLYACVAPNTWMLLGGNTGLNDPGSNGIVVRTAPNTTRAIPAPTGTVVGTTDSQTLTNKTIDGVSPATLGFLDATSSIQTQLNAKQPLLSLPLSIANGGTGLSSVGGLTSGNTNCAVSGNWPNQSIACATGSGGTISGPGTTTSGYFPIWSNTAGTLLGAGVPAPAGAVVGTTDAQTLTNKSIAGSEINSGLIPLAQIPTLSSANISDFATAVSAHAPVQTVAGVSPISGNVALTSTNLADASSLVYLGSTQTLTNKTLDGVSASTFGFLDATSSIQTQLNGKQSLLSFTGTGSKTISATGSGISGHCAQWTAAGDIGDAGAACGTGGSATSPGGSNGQIQYNNAGVFGGLSTIPATNMPAFSGDVASPAGSTVSTLATVNSAPGTFGSATACATFTVNAKGLVTAAGQVTCAGSGGSTGITQLTGDVTTAASSSGSTAATLATVNSTPGTFGSATTTPVITVNGKGLITAVTTAAISGSAGSSTATALTSGSLANLPASCVSGAVYFATDQPAGQQLYTCSSTNYWTQIVSLGPSGALAYANGSLDIVTSIVPLLTSANSFTGLNSFSNGVQLATTVAGQPPCNSVNGPAIRGLFWFLNNGTSKDSLQVCVFNGTSYGWTSLY